MSYEGDSIFWVEVEKIVPNPYQPRREFDESKLKELSESIRMYGILQPLTVSRREVMSEDGAFKTEYELIAGERRLRASKLAGLQQVPVIIRSGEETELMKLELAIIENLQREDLNSVDRGLAFKQLADEFNLSHSQVAKKVGRSREYVSNSIRLLQLPDTILEALKLGDLSEGHARTLLMLNDRPEEQDVLFREILLKKLSVREVEKLARKVATDKVRKHVWKDTDPELMAMERQFTESLGTRVQIAKTDYGGKLTIDYFSAEDLDNLLKVVQGGNELSEEAQEAKASLPTLSVATPIDPIDTEAAAAVEREMKEIRVQAAKERETEKLRHVNEETESLIEEPRAELDLTADAAQQNDSDSVMPVPASEQNVSVAAPVNPELDTPSQQPVVHIEQSSDTSAVTAADMQPPADTDSASLAQTDRNDTDEDLYSLKKFSI